MMNKRSYLGIQSRAYKLNIHLEDSCWDHVWSEEEDNIIRTYYPQGGYINCIDRLIDRTKRQIQGRASTLGCKDESRLWDETEIAYLLSNYPKYGTKCFKKLNRTFSSCASKCRELNIEFDKNQWTDSDIDILYKYYPEGGPDLVLEKLKNKFTRENIIIKASRSGIKLEKHIFEWSQNYDNILIETFNKYKETLSTNKIIKIIADNLPDFISESMIRGRLHDLNLKKGYSIWSDREIQILTKNYSKLGPNQIAPLLPGRSPTCIGMKAQSLGLVVDNNLRYEKVSKKLYKKVQCIETNEIFNSMKEASEHYNNASISYAIQKGKSAGKLPDGTKLHWRYVDEKDI